MKRLLKIAGVLAALAALLSIAGFLALSSDWFRDSVRRRIIAELENATGGRVTLGAFSYTWPDLSVEIRDLTLRGSEPESADPLLAVPRARLQLTILSILRREIDLRSLTVERPAVNLIIGPDGSTNLPRLSTPPSDKGPTDALFAAAIGRFEITGGRVRIDDRAIPVAGLAENLDLRFTLDRLVPRYRGTVKADLLRIAATGYDIPDTKLDAALDIERNRVAISSLKLSLDGAVLSAAGSIDNFAEPRTALDVDLAADIARAARVFRIAGLRAGQATVKGRAAIESGRLTLNGVTSVRGLGYTTGRFALRGVSADAAIAATTTDLTLTKVVANGLGGRFTGGAVIDYEKGYKVDGVVGGFELHQLLDTVDLYASTWRATIAGPVRASGSWRGAPAVDAHMTLTPAEGGVPVSGMIDVALRRNTLTLGASHLATPATRLDLSGDLAGSLRVRLESRDLDDMLPVWRLAADSAPLRMPVKLEGGGVAIFDGTVAGSVDEPVIDGRASVTGLHAVDPSIRPSRIDRAAVNLHATSAGVSLQRIEISAGRTTVGGEASLQLAGWKPEPASAVAGSLTVRAADIGEALKLAGAGDVPLRAAAQADIEIAGTFDKPNADVTLTARRIDYEGEAIERLRASIRAGLDHIEIDGFEATAIGARFSGAAFYTPAPGDWKSGTLRAELRTTEFAIDQSATVRRLRPGLTGMAKLDLKLAARSTPGRPFLLESLNGSAAARGLVLDGRPIGDAALDAATAAGVVKVQLKSAFLNSRIAGEGQWQLAENYPGSAEIRFSELSLSAAGQWFNKDREPSPLDGVVAGKVTVNGPAARIDALKASLQLDTLEVRQAAAAGETAALPVVLRNDGPIVAHLENGLVRIAAARVAGRDTKLELAGSASINQARPLDLRVNGDINLELLRTYNADILSSGVVNLAANVRGTFDKPSITGRLALKDASLNVVDVPNGLTNANGVITFSGTEASIQELAAEIGGGRITATGFFELKPKNPAFRIQTRATNVRIRYPEGVSTTANGNLVLSGTFERSLLTGSVTILRTSFNPRTDLSTILAQSSQPIVTPSRQTGPLSGLQFDVRIETSPDLSVDSSMAESIQAEANLRLRGTAYNPVLLGRVTVTEGEITFFGTRYTVGQGTINFINPVKLEPILNLDLETRVRGIDVILTFSGPINKLNLTHRADPPLEFSEVVALLATGRAPTSDPTLAARQSAADQQSVAQLGASALIGEAIASPISSRLQRFFGVSKLKIDPRLTGVDNNPTARLTLEQQVSKNLTFTYITDLSRANQQIVRVEWALSKEVSMLAIRDENGLFGIDFLYRKSFK